ncbi:fibrinogen-like protein A [Drosophila obscura]|uniref:fibrinogen-like protein A n=1 Tax=Drosophila obscura TaxID=7282 RepID=UPI001BB1AFB8|nr:fibrinogen-like protein A [Drosophila obscura]
MKVISIILLLAGFSTVQLFDYNNEGNSIDFCGPECFEKLKPLLDTVVALKQRCDEYGAQIETLNQQLVELRGMMELQGKDDLFAELKSDPLPQDTPTEEEPTPISSTTPTSSTTPRCSTSPTYASLPTKCASYEESGIHQIQVPGSEPFPVYCEMVEMDEPAWIVVLKRTNGEQQDFYRNWTSYRNGFGDLTDDHFLGLENLHSLTRSVPYELLIQLEDFSGNERYALYSNLRIGNEHEKYKLRSLGEYSGNAGEAMSYHLNNEFTTYDRDNDGWGKGSCASYYGGAWWYGWDANSNLMGRYKDGPQNDWTGIWWFPWKSYTSLKSVKMMIRPAYYTLMQD